jgi:hypothetical protein
LKYERTRMTNFLTHEGGIAAGLTVKLRAKETEAAPGPSEQYVAVCIPTRLSSSWAVASVNATHS